MKAKSFFAPKTIAFWAVFMALGIVIPQAVAAIAAVLAWWVVMPIVLDLRFFGGCG